LLIHQPTSGSDTLRKFSEGNKHSAVSKGVFYIHTRWAIIEVRMFSKAMKILFLLLIDDLCEFSYQGNSFFAFCLFIYAG